MSDRYDPRADKRFLALAPGTSLGAKDILALIGSGGMGEVYRARDTRLRRDVAIKILPTDVAVDPDRLVRLDCRTRRWWRRRFVPVTAPLAGSAATAGLLVLAGQPATGSAPVSRFDITPPSAAALTPGVSRDVAIDARRIALRLRWFEWHRPFVRALDELESTPILRGASPRDPFVSPDGQWVVFFDGGLAFKKVPIAGGPPR